MSVTFQYGADVVTLRNPEQQDTKTTVLGVSTRFNMRGGIRSHRRTLNPKRLLLNFVEVSCGELDDFILFLKNHAGKVIEFVNYDDYVYTGYIISDPTEFTKNLNSTTFTIEFEILTELAPVPCVSPS